MRGGSGLEMRMQPWAVGSARDSTEEEKLVLLE